MCIHDGSAESGHYYTLIKEHTTNIWRKFNDIKVETIAEKDVFENANGGSGQKTAFWVVYLSKSETQTASQYQLYQMINNNHYSAMIDSKLQFEIINQNKALIKEYNDSRDNKTLMQINEKYLGYVEELQALFRHPSQTLQKTVQNCSIYAWLWKQEKKDFCKRAILKLAFNQVTTKLVPEDIGVKDRLWAKV